MAEEGVSVQANTDENRDAFTLVEFLVVCAVVSILAAIVIPALQAARETARSLSCQNNLRQVGLALCDFEATTRAYPVGAQCQVTPGSKTQSYGVSWWVRLLPQLEQNTLADQYDTRGWAPGMVLEHLANGELVDGVELSTMHCPSSPVPGLWSVGGFQVMMPSYVGVAGATSHEGFPERRTNICCVPRDDGEISAGGMLISNRAITRSEVGDGVGHTVVVGEASDFARSDAYNEHRIDGAFPYGWVLGTKSRGTPPYYGTNPSLPSWNITAIRYELNERDYDLPGIILNHGPNNPLISSHPRGVGLLFGDASVKFMHEDVDLTTIKRLATRDDSQNGGSEGPK